MWARTRGRILRFVAMYFLIIVFPSIAQCTEHGEGVSSAPTVVFSICNFPITDSVIMSWIISLLLILAIKFLLRGGVKVVPSTGQAMIESVVDTLHAIIAPIVGSRIFKAVFPCLLGYFSFILLQSLSGLLPGVGSIGVHVNGEFKPFFRPGNADLNTTLALAIVAFFAWAYFCVKCEGLKGLLHEIFGNKANKSEIAMFMYTCLSLIFLAVGLVECISVLCRIISLSFRLFGNTFGGENLLHNMYGFSTILRNIPVVNYLSYLIPLPFYFLEFLVAIIQAFVFTLLVSVYIGLVCNHAGHESKGEILNKESYV
jgi:F-type H+-transporting ATPase subunit a